MRLKLEPLGLAVFAHKPERAVIDLTPGVQRRLEELTKEIPLGEKIMVYLYLATPQSKANG